MEFKPRGALCLEGEGRSTGKMGTNPWRGGTEEYVIFIGSDDCIIHYSSFASTTEAHVCSSARYKGPTLNIMKN